MRTKLDSSVGISYLRSKVRLFVPTALKQAAMKATILSHNSRLFTWSLYELQDHRPPGPARAGETSSGLGEKMEDDPQSINGVEKLELMHTWIPTTSLRRVLSQ